MVLPSLHELHMSEDATLEKLSRVHLPKKNEDVDIWMIPGTKRIVLFVPKYPDMPDMGPKSRLEGEWRDNAKTTFNVHSLNTGSRFEGRGYARALLSAIVSGLGAKEVVALGPSPQLRKRILDKNGFKPSGRDMVYKP